jgi:dihydrofolate synthase/folylpolyglutamate synthase
VEAGLGGRWDATNVLGAPVVVLTNVGLEHTRWLGPTIPDIAREKLAVVRPGATLVLGERQEEVEPLAAETGATIVRPEPVESDLPGYQHHNFEVAATAAQTILARRGSDPRNEAGANQAADSEGLTPSALRAAAAHAQVPGRLQVVGREPLTILDGAHNAPGIAALAESVPEGTVAVLSILDDKDAAAMLRALLPRLSAAVFTCAPNPRALPPATLASLAAQLGGPPAETERDPRRAVERARELAGPRGSVVATGSIYLVADLLSPPGARRASAL